jgi:hypothetical protein
VNGKKKYMTRARKYELLLQKAVGASQLFGVELYDELLVDFLRYLIALREGQEDTFHLIGVPF